MLREFSKRKCKISKDRRHGREVRSCGNVGSEFDITYCCDKEGEFIISDSVTSEKGICSTKAKIIYIYICI